MEEPGSSVVEEEEVDLSGAEDEGNVDRAEGSTHHGMLPESEARFPDRSGSPANSS